MENVQDMVEQEQTNFQGKTVLVFGAGYVGQAVIAALSGSGACVRALTRNEETARLLRHKGVDTLCAELASDDWHQSFREGADFAVDCVGSGGPGLESYRRSYLEGMESLLRWSEHAPLGTLVYTSSISVYAAGGGLLVDETGPLVEDGGNSTILVQTERRLLEAAKGPRRRCVLRLAGIYGPGRHRFLDQLASGAEASGRPQTHLNLIHRDDIVSAILRCWSMPDDYTAQLLNLVDDGVATRGEIAHWLALKRGVPCAGFTGEPAAGRARLSPDRIISNKKAKKWLGWSPLYPSFREGYTALVEKGE